MRVGIIGLGVVGEAYANALGSKHDVIGYDKFKPSDSIDNIVRETDVMLLCLPTPPQKSGEISMAAFQEIMPEIKDYKNPVFIKSTVLPYTNQYFTGKFGLNIISNPEFLTEANAEEDAKNQTKIIIGSDTELDSKVYRDLYDDLLATDGQYFITDSTTAELAKYAGNSLLAMKVSFANEMFDLCSRLGANYDVIRETLLADPRIGKTHLDVTHERGYGGMCFPKDLNAILFFCDRIGFSSNLIKATVTRNNIYRKKDE